jgi:ABC-type protease/lipase transport system fused ATPase/permease subunit
MRDGQVTLFGPRNEVMARVTRPTVATATTPAPAAVPAPAPSIAQGGAA